MLGATRLRVHRRDSIIRLFPLSSPPTQLRRTAGHNHAKTTEADLRRPHAHVEAPRNPAQIPVELLACSSYRRVR